MTNQLPAYLQGRQSRDFTERSTTGLAGALPPHVSIRGNAFTLVDASGNKQPLVDQAGGPIGYMDVCIADMSDHVCKTYYDQDWEPDSADPPLCFSQNGLAPSREAQQPQARTCAECANNVRGSAVSKLSGKAIKACRDEHLLALLLPQYPDMLFRLTLTPGSFKNWRAYAEKFKGQQAGISDVVTRLAFQREANGVLTFEPTSWITEAIFASREKALSGKATDALVGRNDVPIQGLLAAPAQQPALTSGGNGASPFATAGGGGAAAAPFGKPAESTASVPFVASQSAPMATGFSANPAPSPSATPVALEPTKRRRRTKAEMEAERAATAAPPAVSPAMAPFRPNPAQAPSGGPAFGIQASGSVPPNPELTKTINDLFGKQ